MLEEHVVRQMRSMKKGTLPTQGALRKIFGRSPPTEIIDHGCGPVVAKNLWGTHRKCLYGSIHGDRN